MAAVHQSPNATQHDTDDTSTHYQSEESFPLAAQIPLQSFSLPDFPPQASHLRHLTLTSDIKLDEYQSLVTPSSASSSVDDPNIAPLTLPQSITTLTLELFHLGFPARFLSRVAAALPNLRSVTFFSCLVDGLSGESRKDAERFFEMLPLLRDLHVIDSFARSGYWREVGRGLGRRAGEMREIGVGRGKVGESNAPLKKERSKSFGGDGGLKVVEVSFTYRGHDDPEFMGRVGGEEWPELMLPGMVGFSCGFVSPSSTDKEQDGKSSDSKDQAETPLGILPFASDGRAAVAIRRKFEHLTGGETTELKFLNLSMYALSTEDIGHIMYGLSAPIRETPTSALISLTVSILMDKKGWFGALLEAMKDVCVELGELEVIGVPAGTSTSGAQTSVESAESLALDSNNLEKLKNTFPKLASLELSVLKAIAVKMTWDESSRSWKKTAQ